MSDKGDDCPVIRLLKVGINVERSIETTIAVIVILYFLPSVIGWKKQDRGSIGTVTV